MVGDGAPRFPVLPELCQKTCSSRLSGFVFSVDMLCLFEDVHLKSFGSPKLVSVLIFKKHF